ncbi:hypothetical protein ALNOE001_05050 [Candidatus Methanobinarius endosymbioticus]|uniref:Uncharacterized protein n=1 Tax=Candidatus Methanobinarius endosymbioticus TaxID=2006182 RepID=A0A366MD04_9EURY|nr:hypothetical protein ALNOE001_05050 [Candidatus Methanobinarius endosymbioticus]
MRIKIPTITTVSVPDNLTVGDTVTIESRLTDEDENILPDATSDFYVDGEKIGSAITDEYRIARINHTFNKVGNPLVEAKYLGNDTYYPSNATNQTTTRDNKITPPEPTPKLDPINNTNTSSDPIPDSNTNYTFNPEDTDYVTNNNLNTTNAATLKKTGNPIFIKKILKINLANDR